jgi:hypothetical protein
MLKIHETIIMCGTEKGASPTYSNFNLKSGTLVGGRSMGVSKLKEDGIEQ